MTRKDDRLLRSTGGVLLGYVIAAALTVLGRTAIDQAFVPDLLLEPNSFAPTQLSISLQVLLALLTALAAGFLCRWVAGSMRAVLVLASIVAILTTVHALILITLPKPPPLARTGGEPPPVVEEQIRAHQPAWLTLAVPVLLTGGILLGGSRPGRG